MSTQAAENREKKPATGKLTIVVRKLDRLETTRLCHPDTRY